MSLVLGTVFAQEPFKTRLNQSLVRLIPRVYGRRIRRSSRVIDLWSSGFLDVARTSCAGELPEE